MKLSNTVMEKLEALSAQIGPLPSSAFSDTVRNYACGACSGDCKGHAVWD